MHHHTRVHVFLSHNRADKDVARRLGAQMRLAGADVWFDEWEIRAGDSIPGKVKDALAVVDTVVLLWSADADRSEWVRAEFETAITRGMEDESLRVVPIILDDTPLPPLVQRLRRVDLRDGDETRAVTRPWASPPTRIACARSSNTSMRPASRSHTSRGTDLWSAVRRCGAGPEKLRGWSDVDEKRDAMYAGFECTACGLIDGGEM
jgi:hypothetical protein